MALRKLGIGAVLTFDVGRAVANMRSAESRFDRLRGTVHKVQRGLSVAKTAFFATAAATAAVAVPIVGAAKKAADFESAMASLKAVTGATGEEFTRLRDKALEIGRTTVWTATEAAEAQKELAKAGLTVEETIEGVAGVMETAVASEVHYMDVIKMAVPLWTTAGKEKYKLSEITDMLSKAAETATVDFTDLTEALKWAMPAASAVGASFEETTTYAKLLGDAGFRGSLAGTAMRTTFYRLLKPTGEVIRGLKKAGLTQEDLNFAQEGSVAVITKVIDALKNIEDANVRARAATEIFGVRGMAMYEALGKVSTEQLKAMIKDTRDAEGFAKKLAAVKMDTLIGQLKLVKSAVEGLLIAAFTPLLKIVTPMVKELADMFSKVAEAVKLFGEKGMTIDMVRSATEKFGPVITMIASAVRGFLDAITKAIDETKAMFFMLSKAFQEVFGPERIGQIGLMIGSIIKIIPIFSAIIGIAGLLISTLAPIIDFIMRGFMTIAKELITRLIPFLKTLMPIFETIAAIAFPILKALVSILGVIIGTVHSMYEEFAKFLLPIIKSIGEKFVSVFKTISSLVKRLEPVFSLVAKLIGGLFGTVLTVLGKVIEGIVTLIDWITKGIGWFMDLIGITDEAVEQGERLRKKYEEISEITLKRPEVPVPVITPPPVEYGTPEYYRRMGEIARLEAEAARRREMGVEVERILPAWEVAVDLSLDGREIAGATGRAHVEQQERMGKRRVPTR